ncbi:MAG: endonuclease/exonuclease/phosphatase family protein [Candidatus Scalindua sp.]|nr:endonuclease/exonuclease/phosphatase family protein [Candidatus Scalindua sp.]
MNKALPDQYTMKIYNVGFIANSINCISTNIEVVDDEEISNFSDDDNVNCDDGYSTYEQDYLTDEFLLERKNGLLVAQWNCQGFTINAIAHIHYIINNKRPDVFMIQEAYVQYNEKFREWFETIKGYVTWTLKSGFGKIIILVRDGIYAERINIRFKHNIDNRLVIR